MDKHFEWIEKNDFILLVSKEFGLPEDAITPEILTKLIKFLVENGATVQTRVEIPSSPRPDMLFMIIPRTFYHINVKTSLWTAMGLLADILVTRGVATVALVATGKVHRCFGKLVAEQGDVCIYRELWEALKSNQELTIHQICEKLAGNECTKDFPCMYRDNKTRRCGISSEAVNENLKRMKEIGAAADKGKYWRAEL